MGGDWLICVTLQHTFTNDQSRNPLQDKTLPPTYGRRSPAPILNISINDNKVYVHFEKNWKYLFFKILSYANRQKMF